MTLSSRPSRKEIERLEELVSGCGLTCPHGHKELDIETGEGGYLGVLCKWERRDYETLECGWRIRAREIAPLLAVRDFEGRPPGAEAPSCPDHGRTWTTASWRGRVWRLKCIYPRCPWALRWGSPEPLGCMADRSRGLPKYATKARVLGCLAEHGTLTKGQVQKLTGLTEGQVAGVLTRCLRWGYVRRSPTRIPLIPQGSAFTFELTRRGYDFVAWATENGFLEA